MYERPRGGREPVVGFRVGRSEVLKILVQAVQAVQAVGQLLAMMSERAASTGRSECGGLTSAGTDRGRLAM
jgi:hypothetical protein